MIRTLVLGAAMATLASAAVAQPIYVERGSPMYAEGHWATPYAPGYGRVGLCQRWCPQDASPCDPPQYKIADSRCRTSDFRR